jgi:hypothetical protein
VTSLAIFEILRRNLIFPVSALKGRGYIIPKADIMKKLFLGVLLLVLATPCASSAQIICVPDSQFEYPEIARRAHAEPYIEAIFNIDEFTPKNIRLRALDTISESILQCCQNNIIENISRLVYLKDSVNVKLAIKYLIKNENSLNTDYAELVHDDELHIVTHRPLQRSGGFFVLVPDPKLDTVCIEDIVFYRGGKAIPSDILVERRFKSKKDTVVIVRNNHPELTEDIITQAKIYSRQYFLSRGPNAHHYLIRFKVRRDLPGKPGAIIF